MSDLLNKASLVMVPSGYKEDTVYSVVPSDGNGDLAFTRASNGTRINSAGLVEVVPWNLATYSQDFDNSAWTKLNATITANSVNAPNGTTTADTITDDSTNGVHRAINSVSVVNGGVYTYSVYLKNGNINYAVLKISSGVNFAILINLSTKTITSTVGSVTASISDEGDWSRCIFTFTAQDTTATMQVATSSGTMDGDGNSIYVGTGKYCYAWGAQLNIGSTAKPYFPTTDRLNVPRLTYQNGGGGCPSLLLEKQSTNYCKWSNDLTQSSAWIDQTGNTTITQITSGGPDGGSFTRLVSTGSGSQGRMVQTSSITNPNGATMSVYLKGSGTAGFGLFIGNGISQYTQITLTNTWTRYTVSVSGTGSTYQDWEIDCYGGSTVDVSFVQVEVSSYATSPIYTTSSSATRVADVCSKTGISSLIGQTEGVLFADFVANSAETTIIAINDPANPSTNIIYIQAQIGDVWRAYVVNGGVYQVAITAGSGATGRCKMAFAYKQNDFVLYANGQLILADSSGTVPACSAFYLGYYNGAYLPIQTNQCALFKTRLTNSELASLTTL